MNALRLLLVGADRPLSRDVAARLQGCGEVDSVGCEKLLGDPLMAGDYDAVVVALTTGDGDACLAALSEAASRGGGRTPVLAVVEAPRGRSLERAMTSAEIRGASMALPLPADGNEVALAALELAAKGRRLSPALSGAAERWRAALND